MQGKGKGAKSAAKAGKAKANVSSPRTKSRPKAQKAQQRQERLRPGQLDGLVLGYMKKHRTKLPLSSTAVAHGIKRSSGAVGNCLGRLDEGGKVRLASKKPRRYDLAGSTK
ncbi:MAG TPA: hypothetical protein VFJ61_04885 [Solirubrobacterales bacterium]|nr:hypothetical protein [Solirubrobacterales bacterium]